MTNSELKKLFSDLRHRRFGRELTEKEENFLSSKFDTFYKNYMDQYSIGDRSTYDKVFYSEIYVDDGYYYLMISIGAKYYWFKLDGFSALVNKLEEWENKIIYKNNYENK